VLLIFDTPMVAKVLGDTANFAWQTRDECFRSFFDLAIALATSVNHADRLQ
jgi:hypothetical protein